MKNLVLYLLQMIACSGILYGYYHFFLRNNRFHQYNRYYLLMATLISVVVPFLKIPVYISGDGNGFQNVLVDYNNYLLPEVIVTSTTRGATAGWQQFAFIAYAAAAAFLIHRIILAIKRLIFLRLTNDTEGLGRFSVISTSEEDAPFSFFNWIFWNNKIDSLSQEGRQIMKHEVYHARQKHSLDILFMEIICALVWVNPFFHLMKKEIKAIHEFLADNYVSDHDHKLEYAEILVLQAIGSCRQKLVNPFFNNQLKRRITMLTTNKKSSYQYLRKILVLPVLAVIAALFVISCKSSDEKSEKVVNDSIVVADIPQPMPDSATVVAATPEEPVFRDANGNIVPGPEIFTKVEIDAAYPGGPSAWRNFLERSLRGETPVDNGASPGNYTVIIQFVVDKEGNVSDIKPLTRLGFGMEEEAVRVISKSGKWRPAINNGKEVKAYRKQPITFQVLKQ